MVGGHWNQLIAGALAGGGTTAILHPLDLIKVRFQADVSNAARPGLFTVKELLRIKRSQGWTGLYQGFTPNWTASMASWGLYFFFYENIKNFLSIEKKSDFSARYFAASGLAGAATVCVVNPLWVCKTRMCLQSPAEPRKYANLYDALAKILKEEGLRGWYRGLVPGLFGVSHGAVQFTVYENLKNLCSQYDIEASNFMYLTNSTSSKVAAMVITYPYQVIRSRLQIPNFGTSMGAIIGRTWRQEGIKGFYRGLVPSTLRVLPGTAITFMIYENVLKFVS